VKTEVWYHGYKLNEGKIVSESPRTLKYVIKQAGCRAMLLDRAYVEIREVGKPTTRSSAPKPAPVKKIAGVTANRLKKLAPTPMQLDYIRQLGGTSAPENQLEAVRAIEELTAKRA
jgi:hypothetical protein